MFCQKLFTICHVFRDIVNWGTLHLKSRARQREIYFPKYIHIFLLYIERWMGMNCPNLGKIIKRWWSDNFTRLSEIIHKVVQMLRAYIFWTKQIIEILLVSSDDPVPISEPRQSLIAPCLGLGAHEAIAGYTEFSLQRCQ